MCEPSAPSINDRLLSIIGELVAGGVSLGEACEAFEDKYLAVALGAERGNLTRAAARLKVHRNTLHNKLRGRDYIPRRRSRRFGGRPVAGRE